MAYLEKGNLEAAKENINKCMELEDSSMPHVILGRILLEEGNFEESIVETQKALKDKPRQIDALINLALAYKKTGRYDTAERFFKKALFIDANPDSVYHANASLGLMETYLLAGKPELLNDLSIRFITSINDKMLEGLLRRFEKDEKTYRFLINAPKLLEEMGKSYYNLGVICYDKKSEMEFDKIPEKATDTEEITR
jgi:tetratricopeptide (TPR) repeat protein